VSIAISTLQYRCAHKVSKSKYEMITDTIEHLKGELQEHIMTEAYNIEHFENKKNLIHFPL